MITTERLERVAVQVAGELGIEVEQARALMRAAAKYDRKKIVDALRVLIKEGK